MRTNERWSGKREIEVSKMWKINMCVHLGMNRMMDCILDYFKCCIVVIVFIFLLLLKRIACVMFVCV